MRELAMNIARLLAQMYVDDTEKVALSRFWFLMMGVKRFVIGS